ncbi:MAG: molybdopterin molybdotransferase MoeA [Chloroflexota bacterium]|nr:molybdopterin molybdotransferase MoeA [Chloroflexota bacterium]
MSDLLNPDDALAHILADITPLSHEPIPVDRALGRSLAVPLIVVRDLPPFDNSSLDGFALRASDSDGASTSSPVSLPISLDIPAGATPDQTLAPGTAARIMTGAPLPRGADAVIAVEATDQQFRGGDDAPPPACVGLYNTVRPGDGVRRRGDDVQVGQTLLSNGSVLRPQDLGMMASLGHAEVSVIRRPRVVVISTGDELVAPGEALTAGKIYDGNGVMLASLVTLYGAEAIRLPIVRDTLADARHHFQQAIALEPDLIITSGGVSVGAFDVVRAVLEELGAINFWRINLRPGKPLAYGSIGAARIPFFGLPGNPVSAIVTFDVFVRPVLLKMSGLPDAVPTVEASLDDAITSDGRRSYLRVRVRQGADGWHARLTGTQSSGALSSMVMADGLLIVPEGMTEAAIGTRFKVRMFR